MYLKGSESITINSGGVLSNRLVNSTGGVNAITLNGTGKIGTQIWLTNSTGATVFIHDNATVGTDAAVGLQNGSSGSISMDGGTVGRHIILYNDTSGTSTGQIILSGNAHVGGSIFLGSTTYPTGTTLGSIDVSGNAIVDANVQAIDGNIYIHGSAQVKNSVIGGKGDNVIDIFGSAIIGTSSAGGVDGGNGNDVIMVRENANVRQISGGTGNDNITIGDDAIINQYVNGDDGDDIILIKDRAIVTTQISGGTGNDIITVKDKVQAKSYLNGGDGEDTIQVLGDAVISGEVRSGNGNDIIIISDNAQILSYIDGQANDDKIFIQGNSQISGYVTGGAGNDEILVTDEAKINSYLDGGVGSDTLQVSKNAVISGEIRGGAGNDKIFVTDQAQIGSYVDGGDGDDQISISGHSIIGSDVLGGSGNDSISILGSSQVLGNVNGGDGDDQIFALRGGINGLIQGGNGVDSLTVANGIYTVDDMENLMVQSGELRLNQGNYETLQTLSMGIVAPLQTTTTFTGDVSHAGIIDLGRNNSPGDVFSIQGSYIGQQGRFLMDVLMDPAGSVADQLHFSGAVDGQSILDVKGTGPGFGKPGQDALLVDTGSLIAGSSSFRLPNPEVQLGFYNYFLDQRNSQWFLTAVPEIAPSVGAYNKNLLAQYGLVRELMDISQDSKLLWNPWARYIGKSYDLKLGSDYYGSNLYGFQAGVDRRVYLNQKNNTAAFLGVFAGYGSTRLNYQEDAGEVSGNGWHGGLYWIYKQDPSRQKALRLDGTFLWGRQDTMNNSYGPSGYNQDYDADLFGASINAYYGIRAGSGWRLEPGIHLYYSQVKNGDSFTDEAGLRVKKGSIDGIYGEASLKLEKPQTSETGKFFVPYFKIAVGGNMAGARANTIINGVTLKEESTGITGSIGLGVKYEASKHHYWHIEANRLMGQERGWQGFVQLKFFW